MRGSAIPPAAAAAVAIAVAAAAAALTRSAYALSPTSTLQRSAEIVGTGDGPRGGS